MLLMLQKMFHVEGMLFEPDFSDVLLCGRLCGMMYCVSAVSRGPCTSGFSVLCSFVLCQRRYHRHVSFAFDVVSPGGIRRSALLGDFQNSCLAAWCRRVLLGSGACFPPLVSIQTQKPRVQGRFCRFAKPTRTTLRLSTTACLRCARLQDEGREVRDGLVWLLLGQL